MSVNSQHNRKRRLRIKASQKSKLRAAQNKGREHGLAGRHDITIGHGEPYIASHQLSKAGYAYRSARDKAILGT